MTSPLFEVCGLGLTLGGCPILDDLSFSLQQGSFLAIVGPNGAGKSSLLRCLGGLQRKFSGTVLLEGRPILSLSARQIARRIAWVHQNGDRDLGFTVEEFARMSRYPWKDPFSVAGWTREDSRILADALRVAGAEALASRPMNSLSGGERQRALIAAALTQSTDVLFLDEPLTYLDYLYQADILELAERINRERGVTVLMVTHDINTALASADRILALRKGRICKEGPSRDFCDPLVLEDVFGTEFRLFEAPGQTVPHVAPARMLR
ncbi:MAG: ABC transporter ATP-binding protein [Fretibacterium sp.]|nr:ABC transporter ATP-binding protein [Fretibacterium sp.]